MQPPLKSLHLIISQYFSIDNSCKSVSNKNQRGEKWRAEGMLACPDPLKQNKKQQLSDKRAFTLQQLSLSLWCQESTGRSTNSMFLCRPGRNWITPSTGMGCQKAGSTCCPPVRVGRPITGLVQWLHVQRWLCYLHMPIHRTDDCFTHKLRHTHTNQPAIPPTPEFLPTHILISQNSPSQTT